MAGSLIKNPGGTIAPSGGYVAGREDLVKAAAARLAAPGLGTEVGSTSGEIMRLLFQGLFLSPQMVGEAIKVNMIWGWLDVCPISFFFLSECVLYYTIQKMIQNCYVMPSDCFDLFVSGESSCR